MLALVPEGLVLVPLECHQVVEARIKGVREGKGAPHHVALRSLAFKRIRVLFRCWRDRKAYDESTYLSTLKRKGSRLLASIAEGAVSA